MPRDVIADLVSGDLGTLPGKLERTPEGRIVISADGIEKETEELKQSPGLSIPDGGAKVALPLFTASVDAGSTVFAAFGMPGAFLVSPPLEAGNIRVVKLLPEGRILFGQAFSYETLGEGRSAVMRGGSVLSAKVAVAEGDVLLLGIRDGGAFDLDGVADGRIIDPAFALQTMSSPTPPAPTPVPGEGAGGGGCAAGVIPSLSALFLLLPAALLLPGRRK